MVVDVQRRIPVSIRWKSKAFKLFKLKILNYLWIGAWVVVVVVVVVAVVVVVVVVVVVIGNDVDVDVVSEDSFNKTALELKCKLQSLAWFLLNETFVQFSLVKHNSKQLNLSAAKNCTTLLWDTGGVFELWTYNKIVFLIWSFFI